MPIYDFKCDACGYQDELLRKVSATAVEVCPQCAQKTFKRQVSAPSFQLTGSGWYATDFKESSGNQKTKESVAETKPTSSTTCEPGCGCH